MPLYEYECEACGRRFEVIQKFSDSSVDACTLCGKGPVRRLPSSPAIQFKGSGWYITDYAKKQKDTSASGNNADAGGEKKSTDSAAKTDSSTTTTTTSTPSTSKE